MRQNLLISLILFSFSLASQDYIQPMDIPVGLSGNFGEMRRNHFHTGIDIRTKGQEGIPVRAIADGFVSRINVSPQGYGNALYIDHPDGHTSVYAHLSRFNDTLSLAAHKEQYSEESWALEFYPEKNRYKVKLGEVIGHSGNSGSSSGPHLHFEVRQTDNEHPLNPQGLGLAVKDETPPVIQGVRLYPLDNMSTVKGAHEAESYVVRDKGHGQHLLDEDLHATGKIGLALHTFDRMDGVSNKYGVYSLELQVDGVPIYKHVMDELDFGNFRQINCHADYELFKTNAWRYHKCFPAENNTLDIYELISDHGILELKPGEQKNIEFIAKDIQGNSSQLRFILHGEDPPLTAFPVEDGIFWDAGSDNVFRDSSVIALVPKGRIYSDLFLRPSITESENSLSKRFQFHDEDIPLDDYITIKLKVEGDFTDRSRIVMMQEDVKGRLSCLGGQYRNGWVVAKTKSLGTYFLAEDIKAPSVNISFTGKGASSKISLNMSDDLSGVSSLRVEVNGRWLMMAHNVSMSRAWGEIKDLDLESGEYEVVVKVQDVAGNETVQKRPLNL